MMLIKRYIISLIFIFPAINLQAQNLTGTWEGDLGNDQFLQLNIIQTGNKICGYTYDRVKANRKSFCKAFFEGYFDTKKQQLIINGRYFLKNSGSHTLMRLRLKLKTVKAVDVLVQEPVRTILYRERRSIFGTELEPYIGYDSTEYVYIKKVADQPYELIELMKDCIERDKKKTDTIVKFIPKQKDSSAPIVKTIPPAKKDSLPVVIAPVTSKKDTVAIPKTITQRKNKEQSRITVNTKSINLKVYDNAIMDGDTVSILYNGKLLLSHKLLSEKAIEINLELDDKQTRHEIILFAENLGSIPPNTALIVITAGEKRYELFASASLEENAVLVFEYRPK